MKLTELYRTKINKLTADDSSNRNRMKIEWYELV